jgi:hypothetical protein
MRFADSLLPVLCWISASRNLDPLKVEVTCSSKMSVDVEKTVQHHVPENIIYNKIAGVMH